MLDHMTSIPAWKQELIEKRRLNDEEIQRRKDEENRRLQEMPLWKRNIIGKKQKKSYSLETNGHSNGVTPSPDEDEPTSPSSNLPEISRNPWIRSQGLKKKSSPPPPKRSLSTPEYVAEDGQKLDQNCNYDDGIPDDEATEVQNETSSPTLTPADDEVSYGKGFVHRLLQRFKHMTNTEKTRMFERKTANSGRPLSSGDMLSDLSMHDMENRTRRLSDASKSSSANHDFTRAHSMDDLLTSDVNISPKPTPAQRPTKLTNESNRGEVVTPQEADSCDVTPTPDSGKVASVSSRRDQFENLKSPTRPPRRVKRQAPAPPSSVPSSPAPPSPATPIAKSSTTPSPISDSKVSHFAPQSSPVISQFPTKEATKVPSPDVQRTLQSKLSISIENTTTESTDDLPQSNEPMVPTLITSSKRTSLEPISLTSTPAPDLPLSPPPSQQDKTLTDWLSNSSNHVANNTDDPTSKLNTHHHVSYIRTESIDETGHLVGGVCGTSHLDSNEVKPKEISSESHKISTKIVLSDTPVISASKPAIVSTKPAIYTAKPDISKTKPFISSTIKTPAKDDTFDNTPVAPIKVPTKAPSKPMSMSNDILFRSSHDSKKRPASDTGAMLIRPASNLTIGTSTVSSIKRLQNEIRDSQCAPCKSYDDITTGDFAPVRKRPAYYAKSVNYDDDDNYDDDEDVPETNMDDVLLAEGEVNNSRSRARLNFEVIGGGVSLGKNMLQKNPSRKGLRLTFSTQEPVVHEYTPDSEWEGEEEATSGDNGANNSPGNMEDTKEDMDEDIDSNRDGQSTTPYSNFQFNDGDLGNYQSKNFSDSYQWGSLDRNAARRSTENNKPANHAHTEPEADIPESIDHELEIDDSILF